MIQETRKIIKVGTSAAVTIPAKDLKRLGVTYGNHIKVTFEPTSETPQETVELVALTQKLIQRHERALKNLSQR